MEKAGNNLIKDDTTGAQRFRLKVHRNLRKEVTDKARIDVISEEEWKNHYKNISGKLKKGITNLMLCV